jgi:hypothetical protein
VDPRGLSWAMRPPCQSPLGEDLLSPGQSTHLCPLA